MAMMTLGGEQISFQSRQQLQKKTSNWSANKGCNFTNLYSLLLLTATTALTTVKYTVSQKTSRQIFVHMFAKYWSIFLILLLAHSIENLR